GDTPRIRVMALLLSEGDVGLSVSAIARLAGICRPTATQVLGELIKIKFVYNKGIKHYLNRYDNNTAVLASFYHRLITNSEVCVDE
ncbi:MAG: hypothetical protein WC307_06770, partial [Candidatus Nanoarchaeia archaeon]